jgi:HAD superfamily hydrolase (TIGR01509 family)
VKAAIFDMDGTLIDSNDHHARAWQDVFHEYGREVGFQEVRDQIGKGGDELMPVFLNKADIAARGEEIEARRAEIFARRYLPQVQAFPEVRALFERLIDDGVQVALASSAKADELEKYQKIAGIEDLVSVETSSDDADRSKPHPDVFQAALGKAKVSAKDAIAIGDTPYDAEAAGKAGVRTIGFLCGGWSEADLRKAGCFMIYRDPANLLEHYADSPFWREPRKS